MNRHHYGSMPIFFKEVSSGIQSIDGNEEKFSHTRRRRMAVAATISFMALGMLAATRSMAVTGSGEVEDVTSFAVDATYGHHPDNTHHEIIDHRHDSHKAGGAHSHRGDKSSSIFIQKRTFSSIDAVADSRFLRHMIGLKEDMNHTYSCSPGSPGFQYSQGDLCAVRKGHVTLGFIELHLFESFVTPTGPRTVKTWVEYWNKLHSGFKEGFKWHEFMPMGVTLYSPDLTPFLERWQGEHVPMLLRRYTSPIDGNVIYSGRVVMPNNGHVIEIVSGKVKRRWTNDFPEYASEECPGSNYVPWGLEEMYEMWLRKGGNMTNGWSQDEWTLPWTVMVKMSQPVSKHSIFDMADFMEQHTNANLSITGHSSDTDNCQWADTLFDAAESVARENVEADPYDPLDPDANPYLLSPDELSTVNFTDPDSNNYFEIPVRMVHNPNAYIGEASLEFYEHYYDTTVTQLVGQNKGYSRYLDNHLGIYISSGFTVDQNAKSLAKKLIPFHNGGGNTKRGDSEGSNWCRGISGLGVEFRGFYNNEFFPQKKIVQLDYCTETGFPAHVQAALNDATYCAGE